MCLPQDIQPRDGFFQIYESKNFFSKPAYYCTGYGSVACRSAFLRPPGPVALEIFNWCGRAFFLGLYRTFLCRNQRSRQQKQIRFHKPRYGFCVWENGAGHGCIVCLSAGSDAHQPMVCRYFSAVLCGIYGL
jgi:hypothetical protein